LLPARRKEIYDFIVRHQISVFTSRTIELNLGLGLHRISNRLTELERWDGLIVQTGTTKAKPHYRIYRLARPDEIAEFQMQKEEHAPHP
jgi:hypothetical protein